MSEKSIKKKSAGLRLNILDFLIILAVLGALIGIAARFGILEKVTTGSRLEKAEISFLVQDIKDTSADYFRAGEIFYNHTHSCVLGELKEITSIMPAEGYISNQNGTLVKTHSTAGRIDVRGVITGEGLFSDEGFLLGGTSYLAPNQSVFIQSPGISVSVTITAIEPAQK